MTTLIPAVGYIRMSTDKQTDSPARQRGEIERLAERSGYEIIGWYEDHGLTGTESKNRPEFQRLLADAPDGRFRAVLIYEQSRFSREDVLDAMVHWRLLSKAGVKLVTCQRGELCFDDLGGLLTAVVGQHQARSESVHIAERSSSGRLAKARQGKRVGGRSPFGYDRVVFDATGQFVQQITFRERFHRPKEWSSRLVPSSDAAAVEAVRYAFENVARGQAMWTVAHHLNSIGVRTPTGRQFTSDRLKKLLRNPVYAGVLRFGHEPAGKFVRCDGELVLVSEAHPAIVSMALFQKVQTVLDGRFRPRGKSESGRYLLSGLVYCIHCGGRMHGSIFRKKLRSGDGTLRQYRCNSSCRWEQCDVHPAVNAVHLEELVLRHVRENVLCDENLPAMAEALRRLEAESAAPSLDEQQLAEVRRKIKLGEQNLALADGRSHAAIARLLDAWYEQERTLLARLQKPATGLNESSLRRLASLVPVREQLHLAGRVPLSIALRESVVRVEVGRGDQRRKANSNKRAFGRILLAPMLSAVAEIRFDDWQLNPSALYVQIANYVGKAGRAVSLAELSEALGVGMKAVRQHAERAVLAGLINEPARGAWGYRPVATP